MGKLVDVAGAILCIGAGIYLLQYHAAGDSTTGTNWFEILGHGMGIYFIGRGLFGMRAGFLAADQRDYLRRIARFAALDHPDAAERFEETDDRKIDAALRAAGIWDHDERQRAHTRVVMLVGQGMAIDAAIGKVTAGSSGEPAADAR